MTARRYGNVIDIVPVLASRAGRPRFDRDFDVARGRSQVIPLPVVFRDDHGPLPPAAA